MKQNIGFMQGRLSPIIDGKIQAFPTKHWQQEFKQAQDIGLQLIEWTLDQTGLHENPFLTQHGQEEIRSLCKQHLVTIPSVTGDCFMQAPFWKANGTERKSLQRDFISIANASSALGVQYIVVPLVDGGRLERRSEEDLLISFLTDQTAFFAKTNLKIVFESDFTANDLARFIDRFPATYFGINYDTGNSAALGYDHKAEFEAYGDRILNVHIKDRVLGGTTVPLGEGATNYEVIFDQLAAIDYQGNYILQTARASKNNHGEVLASYRDMVIEWIQHAKPG
ncbi:sugar phosphate isomerase/epimerase family protein [Lentilitoribacter sp. Alg239-R112]|uniref:sugar phosphate isomerase/epimerase family protein n=1 Tax=Lentilitoribacter sp. Alg239-R112 TaxID=2305987 RepID=UPI0013A69435|nr:sugar phosphate isomerase/epimerase family protein [Lentilitoribacter sp. Alg239-R112]